MYLTLLILLSCGTSMMSNSKSDNTVARSVDINTQSNTLNKEQETVKEEPSTAVADIEKLFSNDNSSNIKQDSINIDRQDINSNIPTPPALPKDFLLDKNDDNVNTNDKNIDSEESITNTTTIQDTTADIIQNTAHIKHDSSSNIPTPPVLPKDFLLDKNDDNINTNNKNTDSKDSQPIKSTMQNINVDLVKEQEVSLENSSNAIPVAPPLEAFNNFKPSEVVREVKKDNIKKSEDKPASNGNPIQDALNNRKQLKSAKIEEKPKMNSSTIQDALNNAPKLKTVKIEPKISKTEAPVTNKAEALRRMQEEADREDDLAALEKEKAKIENLDKENLDKNSSNNNSNNEIENKVDTNLENTSLKTNTSIINTNLTVLDGNTNKENKPAEEKPKKVSKPFVRKVDPNASTTDLLSSIQKGTTLKKSETIVKTLPGQETNDLLSAIKKGTTLKKTETIVKALPVKENREQNPGLKFNNALLEQAIQKNLDNNTDSEDNNDEWNDEPIDTIAKNTNSKKPSSIQDEGINIGEDILDISQKDKIDTKTNLTDEGIDLTNIDKKPPVATKPKIPVTSKAQTTPFTQASN